MNQKKLLTTVVPVYNEEAVIDSFYQRMSAVFDSITEVRHQLIFVDDGSHDRSCEMLQELARKDPRIKIIKFSRNFGHQTAITAGMDHSDGDAVVVIDADLQDPPELIATFLEKWREGYDVVYAVRENREGESAMKLITAATFYRLLRSMINIDIPVDVGDFRLMSRRVVAELRKLREHDRFVRGLVSWLGFKQIGVPYAREKRHAGETKYPYRKMLKFALDGITSFSTVPLRLVSWLGYFTSVLAFLYLISVFVQKAFGGTVQGWATIMVGVLFLGGVQLISLGIIGEYIGRIFNEIKGRPIYVVEEIYEGSTEEQA